MNERASQCSKYCQDISTKTLLHYTLSASEYKYCSVILESSYQNKNIDGIVAYSLFQLPENISKRNKILNKIIKEKSFIGFAVEDIFVNKIKDIKRLINLECKKI